MTISRTEPRQVTILGVPIDDVTEDEAAARIGAFVAQGGPHQVCTINPEFLMEARRAPAFRQALAGADLRTPDGFGLLLVARLRGTPFRGRVTGVELTLRIAREAAARGWRLFLLGAGPGVAERAAAALERHAPGLQVAGWHTGSPRPEDDAESCAIVAGARPDILLLAYPHAAQELWIARNQPRLRVPVAIGVGGTFDYLAGVLPRAPAWIRRLGLEWLFRLARQPQRWRRMINAVPLFLWATLRERPRSKASDADRAQ